MNTKIPLTSEDLYPYASAEHVAVRICRDEKWFIGMLYRIELSNESLAIRLSAIQVIEPPLGADASTEIIPPHEDSWKKEFWHSSPPVHAFNDPRKAIEGSTLPVIKIECDDGIIILSKKNEDLLATERLLENKPR